MEFSCPHCGKVIEVTKRLDVTKSKPVGRPKASLSEGVVVAVTESVDAVVSKVDPKVSAMTSLEVLSQIACGNLSKSQGDSLGSGWGGAMFGALRKRSELIQQGEEIGKALSPEEFAKANPESVNKEAVAGLLQKMIHGALNKGEKK